MKTQGLFLVLPLALLGACSNDSKSSTPPAVQASSPSAPAQADEPLLAPEDAAIPTDQEAADKAAKTIDDSNADAELEKLKKELAGGK